MGFFARFKRKPKEENAAMGIEGQPFEVISEPPACEFVASKFTPILEGAPSPHPNHYDRTRNAARIAQLTEAISGFEQTGAHEVHAERYAELKAELDKQLKIRDLFYCGEEV